MDSAVFGQPRRPRPMKAYQVFLVLANSLSSAGAAPGDRFHGRSGDGSDQATFLSYPPPVGGEFTRYTGGGHDGSDSGTFQGWSPPLPGIRFVFREVIPMVSPPPLIRDGHLPSPDRPAVFLARVLTVTLPPAQLPSPTLFRATLMATEFPVGGRVSTTEAWSSLIPTPMWITTEEAASMNTFGTLIRPIHSLASKSLVSSLEKT